MMRFFVGLMLLIGFVLVWIAVSFFRQEPVGRGCFEGESRTCFFVDVAQTLFAQHRGLSGREKLADDEAMVFVYNSSEVQSFWMKDMLFSIDIVWISHGKVVGVEKQLPFAYEKGEKLPYYSSGEPVDMVVEIRGGLFDEKRLSVGDQFVLDL